MCKCVKLIAAMRDCDLIVLTRVKDPLNFHISASLFGLHYEKYILIGSVFLVWAFCFTSKAGLKSNRSCIYKYIFVFCFFFCNILLIYGKSTQGKSRWIKKIFNEEICFICSIILSCFWFSFLFIVKSCLSTWISLSFQIWPFFMSPYCYFWLCFWSKPTEFKHSLTLLLLLFLNAWLHLLLPRMVQVIY